MKKEIIKYETVCDICENELYDSGVRTNCGKFEEPYYKTHSIDLCYTCAGKLFATQIASKLTADKIKVMIDKTKTKVNPEGILQGDYIKLPGDFTFNNDKVKTGQDPFGELRPFTNFVESEVSEETIGNSLDSIDDPKNVKDL